MSGHSDLSIEQIAERIEGTEPESLRAAARSFDAAADGFGQVRGRVNGVVGDTHAMWDSPAGAAFTDHSGKVVRGLADVAATLRLLAGQLRGHADVTEEAKAGLAPYRTKNPYHPYTMGEAVKQAAVNRIVMRFHDSERRVRMALWARGEQAPGPLPVPPIPPPPKPPWWQSLIFGPGPVPSWVTKDGDPWTGKGQPYGYDEDGDLAPAHRAAHTSEKYPHMDGAAFAAILRWIAGAGKAGKAGQAAGADDLADAVATAVTRSQPWRSGDMDRHIGEFYGLSEGADIPESMRAAFACVVREAGESRKVFRWELPPPEGRTVGEPTFALMRLDRQTHQWLVVQFYQQGPKAGEFATAFRPSALQVNQLLQQNALGEGGYAADYPGRRAGESLSQIRSRLGLTEHDGIALDDYTWTGYLEINRGLRHGVVAGTDVYGRAEALSAALAKLPKYGREVYRGAQLSPEQIARYEPGRLVYERGFTSASADPYRAFLHQNVNFTIVSRNGRIIDHVSRAPRDEEVLFDWGTWFQVLRKDVDPQTGKVAIVMLEVVR